MLLETSGPPNRPLSLGNAPRRDLLTWKSLPLFSPSLVGQTLSPGAPRTSGGYGASDFFGLAFACFLIALVLAQVPLETLVRKIAQRGRWCMFGLAGFVIVLRLALLPVNPAPTAQGADDFSYLLAADTLAHFRLANPPHPMHRFFETNFVLQEPSYSSIYPLGPAIPMAVGELLFHSPWVGIVLCEAVFCALCFWMLCGWTTPGWALLGGLLSVCEFGPLCYWMNSYWGGCAVSAIAGCLVFGALPRFWQRRGIRDAALMGLGIGMQMLSRPYESLFLDLAVVLFFVMAFRHKRAARSSTGIGEVSTELAAESGILANRPFEGLAKTALAFAATALPALALIALHNHAVTCSWTTLPYMLSRYQYGVPTTFTFQPNPVAHAHLTAAQQLYYEGQAAAHDVLPGFFNRLASRTPFVRFFLLPPLFLAMPFFFVLVSESRFAWLALTLLLFGFGANLYPYFFPHYVAAVACLVLLAAVSALRRLARLSPVAARCIVIFCAAHFLFWYGINAFGGERILSAFGQSVSWDLLPRGDPDHRIAINTQLDQAPGKQLVFVRYWPGHGYHEWIHNAADIDHAQVVMALDLGPEENVALERYYPDRTVWLLQPDANPPTLEPYPAPPSLAPLPVRLK